MGASITVRCEGDAYIDDFDTEDLVAELRRRKCKEVDEVADDVLEDVHKALKRKDYEEALWLVERTLFPKWRSLRQCEEAARDVTLQRKLSGR